MSDVCNVCGSARVQTAHSLSHYPRNSLYLEKPSTGGAFLHDFHVEQCLACFHIQGVSDMPIDALYSDDYSYNTGNAGVQNRVDFMVDRVIKRCEGQRFNRVIDVGCNDLTLLKVLKSRGLAGKHFIGIDPVSIKKADGVDGIEFIQGYIQDVDIPHAGGDLPDVIVSDQTFEHIPRVNEVLGAFRKKVSPGSVLIVCVPSLELMIENFSFHNIIHEHVNYFSENALARLFQSCGFSFESSEAANRPSVGLLLQVFTAPSVANATNAPLPRDCMPSFERNYAHFLRMLAVARDVIDGNPEGTVYGFGASDITANLAYFMKSDLARISAIIDDTPYKQNRYIPLIKPSIIKLSDAVDLGAATVLITAPQASRPITTRLLSLSPRKIVNPLSVF